MTVAASAVAVTRSRLPSITVNCAGLRGLDRPSGVCRWSDDHLEFAQARGVDLDVADGSEPRDNRTNRAA